MTVNGTGRRLLIFADANFIPHTSRVVEVARVLRDEYGYEVVFAGTGRFSSIAKNEGLVTDNVFTVSKAATLELARRAGLVDMRWWVAMCDRSIRSDLEVIQKHQPDVILGDMHWSLFAAAQEAQVPYVTIANAHWTEEFSGDFAPMQDHWTYPLLRPFPKAANKAFPWIRSTVGKYWALPYTYYGWKKKLDRRATGICDVITGADLVLLADVPSYGPVDHVPAHYKYCGPILWEPHIPEPTWLAELDPNRPTLYVTMGSTGDPKFFHDTVEAYADSEYQVIVTTGRPLGHPRERLPHGLRAG